MAPRDGRSYVNMKDISLIGFMGCGKSSVGKILATLLPECRLIDLDTYIEEKQGKDIPEIFNEYGEAAFRRMEREALEEIFSDPDRPRAILSLGGGTVTSEECRQLIRRHTECFYLRATTDTLLDNLEGHSEGRPMLSSAQTARFDKLSDRYENSPNNGTTVAEPMVQLGSPTDETSNADNQQSKSPKMFGAVADPVNITDKAPEAVAEPVEAPCTEIPNEKDTLLHRIESLMQARSTQYLATAHHIIDIDDQTFAQIATIIKETVEHNILNIKR